MVMPRSFSSSMWSMVAPAAVAMHFLHAVDSARVVQDPLAQRGLARVDVGRNADISQMCQVHVCRRPWGTVPIFVRRKWDCPLVVSTVELKNLSLYTAPPCPATARFGPFAAKFGWAGDCPNFRPTKMGLSPSEPRGGPGIDGKNPGILAR